eukprot:CAMPEP_0167742408 /NCGR_PEP_ID=MMETSP0110_2-20121227/1411_1 /TAXON_ID=629695 /ORGANISM="Gymnochlora sp., Strain CCMP2014" /LENGTH=590 /DNA_ID=CAMNT_0007626599 /DNA_START=125 /DNA_END=1897 /DNA_ORIENTATION=+
MKRRHRRALAILTICLLMALSLIGDRKIGADVPSDAAVYAEWAISNGCKIRKCEIQRIAPTQSRTCDMGHGLVAIEDITAGDVVVSIPEELVLVPQSCMASEILAEISDTDDLAFRLAALVLAIMSEACYGEASRHCILLKNHSPSPTCLQFWNENELKLLKGTSTYMNFHAEIDVEDHNDLDPLPTQMWDWFRLIIRPFIQAHPEFFPGMSEDDEGLSQLYRWALAAECSNSFMLGDESFPALVPIWNIANHSPLCANLRLNYNHDEKRFEMIVSTDVEKGEQLFVSYGDLPNSELLRKYGFVDGSASSLVCTEIPPDLIFTIVSEALGVPLENLKARLEFLHTSKLLPESMSLSEIQMPETSENVWQSPGPFVFSINARGEPRPELLEAIRLLSISADQFGAFRKRLSTWSHGKPSPINSRDHIVFSENYVQILLEIVHRRLTEYLDTSSDLSGLAAESEINSKRRELAQMIRDEEIQSLNLFAKELSKASERKILEAASSSSLGIWSELVPYVALNNTESVDNKKLSSQTPWNSTKSRKQKIVANFEIVSDPDDTDIKEFQQPIAEEHAGDGMNVLMETDCTQMNDS